MPRKTNSQRLDDLEETVTEVEKTLCEMQGELHNGLHTRVKLIERMQWWQIGIMVVIIGSLVAGMWTMLQRGSQTARENQKILLEHIQKTERLLEDR